MSIIQEIRQRLEALRDDKNVEFVSKLFPTIDSSRILAIRTPVLRNMAKEMVKRSDVGEFLADMPHQYHDENQLHAFIISVMRDYGQCMQELERFLPYVDNWATCDQLSPKVLAKHKTELLEHITAWLASPHDYTVRYGMGRLMALYLDDDFEPRFLEMVARVERDEYYVQMMQAWYFATALAKQWQATMPYLLPDAEGQFRLNRWVHNNTIQKAIESYRITPEQKAYLRTLRRKS